MAYISFQPSDHYNTKLYTGNGTAIGSGGNAITGVGFQPDAVWLKDRDGTTPHAMTDSVRGTTKQIRPNDIDAEETKAEGLTTFGADGFTVGSDTTYNTNTNDYVSWNWKAGTTSGITGGTITPTAYSFNTTAVISILTYTGNNTSGATIAHGLGVVPEFFAVKCLNTTTPWRVYHVSLGADFSLVLNESDAKSDNSTFWNDTTPTDTLITLGDNAMVNATDDYVMYVFASKKGYSKMGSYTGNGNADGAFVYTGFRPAWIMIKRTDSSNNWMMFDDKREGYNIQNDFLLANSTAAESSSDAFFDILSNGFKITATNAALNASGGTYVYAAFAEFPLVSSNDVPGVAR